MKILGSFLPLSKLYLNSRVLETFPQYKLGNEIKQKMNLFGILSEGCENCGKNHFLYKTDFECITCKKDVCKLCSHRRNYFVGIDKKFQECYSCFDKTNIDIRKMLTSENGIIKDYDVIKEHTAIINSNYYTNTFNAIEQIKHMSLLYGYNAITYLKMETYTVDRTKIINLKNRKSAEGLQLAYMATGIPVGITKQL